MPLITSLEPARGRASGFILHLDGAAVCRVSDDLRIRLRLAVGDELKVGVHALF